MLHSQEKLRRLREQGGDFLGSSLDQQGTSHFPEEDRLPMIQVVISVAKKKVTVQKEANRALGRGSELF